MGNLAYGDLAKYFAKEEASYGTVQAFAADDAVGLIDLKLQPFKNYALSKEHLGSPSAQTMIAGRRGGKWSAQSYVKPAAAGTAPDVRELMEAAMGAEADNASDVTYTLASSTPKSLQLAVHDGDALYEVATGAWVEQLDIEAQGESEPLLNFSGGYATHGWVYGTTVADDCDAAETVIPYATANKGNVGINGRAKFGSEDNSGAGYLVTGIDETATPPTMTISPGLANAILTGAVVAPVTPSQTLGGTVISAVSCGLTVDGGSALHWVSLKLQLKTGHVGRDKEATSDRSQGVLRGRREITGEIDVLFADTDNAHLFGRAWNGTNRALAIRIGPDVAGSRLKINLPAAFLEVTPIEIPGEGPAMAKLKFRALQSAAANDEMTLVFD